MKSTLKEVLWLGVPVVALFVLIGRVFPVLPAVMQDEYIYSTQSRLVPFAEQQFPNYLFSWVYSSTSACGDGFYNCAKGLNILFFLVALIFIYLIARSLLGWQYAVAAVTFTILSPVGVSISFFMPETMYFAFMMATVWFITKASQRGKWIWWLFTGVVLGITTLVKPHALFALPVVFLFVVLLTIKSESRSWPRAIGTALLASASALPIKFGLGYAFAGQAGLSLFGQATVQL